MIKKLRDRGYAVTRKSSTFIIITWKDAIKNEAFESLKTSKSRIEKLVELPILRNVKAGRNSVEIGFEKHTHVGDFFYVLIRTLEEAGYTVIQSSCGLRIKIAW